MALNEPDLVLTSLVQGALVMNPGLFQLSFALGAEVIHNLPKLVGAQSFVFHGLPSFKRGWHQVPPPGDICGKVETVNQKNGQAGSVMGLTNFSSRSNARIALAFALGCLVFAGCKKVEEQKKRTHEKTPAAVSSSKKAKTPLPSPRKTLPRRRGKTPKVKAAALESTAQHWQLDQNSPPNLRDLIVERAQMLPGIRTESSGKNKGGPIRFLRQERSVAEFSEEKDGSLRLVLPQAWAQEAVEKGWGRALQAENEVRLFGPRDGDELEVLSFLLRQALLAHPGPISEKGVEE
jgi:hypothetical protein